MFSFWLDGWIYKSTIGVVFITQVYDQLYYIGLWVVFTGQVFMSSLRVRFIGILYLSCLRVSLIYWVSLYFLNRVHRSHLRIVFYRRNRFSPSYSIDIGFATQFFTTPMLPINMHHRMWAKFTSTFVAKFQCALLDFSAHPHNAGSILSTGGWARVSPNCSTPKPSTRVLSFQPEPNFFNASTTHTRSLSLDHAAGFLPPSWRMIWCPSAHLYWLPITHLTHMYLLPRINLIGPSPILPSIRVSKPKGSSLSSSKTARVSHATSLTFPPASQCSRGVKPK